jgi:hypothetical protein
MKPQPRLRGARREQATALRPTSRHVSHTPPRRATLGCCRRRPGSISSRKRQSASSASASPRLEWLKDVVRSKGPARRSSAASDRRASRSWDGPGMRWWHLFGRTRGGRSLGVGLPATVFGEPGWRCSTVSRTEEQWHAFLTASDDDHLGVRRVANFSVASMPWDVLECVDALRSRNVGYARDHPHA